MKKKKSSYPAFAKHFEKEKISGHNQVKQTRYQQHQHRNTEFTVKYGGKSFDLEPLQTMFKCIILAVDDFQWQMAYDSMYKNYMDIFY